MASQYPYKQLLLLLIVVKYIWEQYVNLRQLGRTLLKVPPPEVTEYGVSEQQFQLGQLYAFDKLAFQMLALSIRAAVECLRVMTNILPFIWDNIAEIFPFLDMESEFQRAVGFVLIEAFLSKAFVVPFSAYGTFVIDKKYAKTQMTVNMFVFDLIVTAVFTLLIFSPIIYGYLRVVQIGGEYFYIFLQVLAILVTIIVTWVHPNIIAPIFNELTPIRSPDIERSIQTLAKASNFPLNGITSLNNYRSQHSQAYFYGSLFSKTIVLSESLFARLTRAEICAVVAHQIGHWYHWHPFRKVTVYLFQVLCMFYIFSFFMHSEGLFKSFGFSHKSTIVGTALFFNLFQPLTAGFATWLLVQNRQFEFEADAYACRIGFGEELKTSLIKLHRDNAGMIKPDVLYAWVKHSHPTVHERLEKIEDILRRKRRKN